MAAVIKFPGATTPEFRREDIRVVADLDDGFTRTANEIQKAKCRLRIAGRDFCVLEAVIYSTFGWNKKQDFVTNTYLADMCEMDPADVSKALTELANRKIITLEKRGYMKLVGINKVVSEWKTARTKTQKNLGNSAKTLGENAKKVGCFDLSKQMKTPNTQDSLTQDNKQHTIVATSGSQSADAELPSVADTPVAKQPTRPPALQYQAFADAYNAILGHRLPRCEALSDKRKRAIKALAGSLRPDRPAIEAFTAYLEDFRDHASGFYFGENDRGWRAGFDYLVRVETLLKAREGALMEGGRS